MQSSLVLAHNQQIAVAKHEQSAPEANEGNHMPIRETDPWRMQYFDGLPPARTTSAFRLRTAMPGPGISAHKWIYNKLAIVRKPGPADAGPHGRRPAIVPGVFSKPIYNMRGMGAGSRVHAQRKRIQAPAASRALSGCRCSRASMSASDVAVVDGEPKWWRHVIGKSLEGGMFDYWTVLAEPNRHGNRGLLRLPGCGVTWLPGYTGMVNLETIGASHHRSAHMRFSLTSGRTCMAPIGWTDALVRLYAEKRCGSSRTPTARDAYSAWCCLAPTASTISYPPRRMSSTRLRQMPTACHRFRLPFTTIARLRLIRCRRVGFGSPSSIAGTLKWAGRFVKSSP